VGFELSVDERRGGPNEYGPDIRLWHRAIHEAAHAVMDALQPRPVYYSEICLRATDGNTAFGIRASSRVKGGHFIYSMGDHQDAALQEILVALSGPAASVRIDPKRSRRLDESDYRCAEDHARGLSAATGKLAASYIGEGEEAADAATAQHWATILTVGGQLIMAAQGVSAAVHGEEITKALRKAGLDV
jgi:hypothetical protein